MSARDSFVVYLRELSSVEVEYRRADDKIGERHVLSITEDVSLYVRPADENLDGTIAGLRKLAAVAGKMADALAGNTDGAA